MDSRFTARVWAALAAGLETCATAVSTVPCTKNPIVGIPEAGLKKPPGVRLAAGIQRRFALVISGVSSALGFRAWC
jgi:hypothetical protein